jgi:hypothetical protein
VFLNKKVVKIVYIINKHVDDNVSRTAIDTSTAGAC